MESLPILVAAVFAVGVILIFAGFASASRVDPVQARLSQLGTMQARNLEELELQEPIFERTLRPWFDSLAARVERLGGEFEQGLAVVPVQMPALAVVIQQPVPVTELDALGHPVHHHA